MPGTTFLIDPQPTPKGVDLTVAFGVIAQNCAMTAEVEETMKSLSLPGGELALITGPASLCVIGVIIHKIAHIYAAVGIYDPKLGGHVVVVSHHPDYTVGQLLKS